MIDPESVKGFLHPEEGRRLHALALEAARSGPCLEVGSYCGKSGVYLGAAHSHIAHAACRLRCRPANCDGFGDQVAAASRTSRATWPIVGITQVRTNVGHRRMGDRFARTYVVGLRSAGRPIIVPDPPPAPDPPEP